MMVMVRRIVQIQIVHLRYDAQDEEITVDVMGEHQMVFVGMTDEKQQQIV
jgi:hypothetical protein